MKLFIPAEYIRTKNYMKSAECPITCALADAGRPDLKDQGICIEDQQRNVVISFTDPKYRALVYRIAHMVEKRIPIQDITVELNIK